MKTSKKDFEYFRERCLFWAERFGLDEWDLRINHETHPASPYSLACSETQYMGCIAVITLNPDWHKDVVSRESLDSTARHEMAHILIGNLADLAEARWVTKDEVLKAGEALVVKLARLLA